MVISQICTQGLPSHWKALDQLAGSFSGLQSITSFICSSVYSLCLSLVHLLVRPSVLPFVGSEILLLFLSLARSFVRSFDWSIVRSFAHSFVCSCFVFRQVFCSFFVANAIQRWWVPCWGSTRIPTNDFFHFTRWLFHDIPSTSLRFLHQSRAEVTRDGHSAEKTN